ncbi:MAG: DUF3153 domain-containing protein [Desertifilum sp. SIO1I2]|nr:DUF3153 domain-containing protein [Desertifilum sp. SIO1I2]
MRRPKSVVLWLIPLYLCLVTLLSGCVRYDVGVNFESPTHGEMIQHIKLADRLTSFSRTTAEDWLKSIERRTRQLQGRTQRISEQDLTVIIPFDNGADLQKKFNQFFNPVENGKTTVSEDLPQFESHLEVRQNNLLFWIRNHVELELDLRSLGVISSNGNVLVSPGSLLELAFSLTTPWGAKPILTPDASAINPQSDRIGNQVIWHLEPGQINHIEAVFWLPSPIGIGALVIVLFVALGMYLKSQLSPVGVKTANPSA